MKLFQDYPVAKVIAVGLALVLGCGLVFAWRYKTNPAPHVTSLYDFQWTYRGRSGSSTQVRLGDFVFGVGFVLGAGLLGIAALHIHEKGIDAE